MCACVRACALCVGKSAVGGPFYFQTRSLIWGKRILDFKCLFVRLSVCLSVRPHGRTRLPLLHFLKIIYLSAFRKSAEKIQVSQKSYKNDGILREDSVQLVWYIAVFAEREMFQVNVSEKLLTRILYSIIFFRKLCNLWDNAEKYIRAGQATDASNYGACALRAAIHIALRTCSHNT